MALHALGGLAGFLIAGYGFLDWWHAGLGMGHRFSQAPDPAAGGRVLCFVGVILLSYCGGTLYFGRRSTVTGSDDDKSTRTI